MKQQEPVPGPPTRRIPLEAIPVWLQAFAAVAAVLVTAVGVFGLASGQPAATTPAGTQVPTAAPIEVALESVVADTVGVHAVGTYSGLDPASQAVLFIGQPISDANARWLPVEATTTASTTGADGRESGRWVVDRPPAPSTVRYSWYAVIGPKAGGASDPYEDLFVNGPKSDLVSAVSAPFETGG